MNKCESKKAELLLLCIQDFRDVPFYSFIRRYHFDFWGNILSEIENIFPQMQVYFCEDIDYFKMHFTIISTKTKKVLGKIDMDYDSNMYEVVCKILCFCDDYLYQHTLVKTDSTSPQVHHCTSCGAALKRNSYKCDYCGTEYW